MLSIVSVLVGHDIILLQNSKHLVWSISIQVYVTLHAGAKVLCCHMATACRKSISVTSVTDRYQYWLNKGPLQHTTTALNWN